MEYYLLYYDRWEREETDDMMPVLTYCASIGKLSDTEMEKLAGAYGIYYSNKEGYWNYSSSGFLEDLIMNLTDDGILCIPAGQGCGHQNDGLISFYELRSRQSLSEGLKILCAKATANFKEADREGTTDGRIALMRKVIIATGILRGDSPASVPEQEKKPKDKKKRRTQAELKLLIEATVAKYGNETTDKLVAEQAAIHPSMLSREPYCTYLENARNHKHKQGYFEDQHNPSFDEKLHEGEEVNWSMVDDRIDGMN